MFGEAGGKLESQYLALEHILENPVVQPLKQIHLQLFMFFALESYCKEWTRTNASYLTMFGPRRKLNASSQTLLKLG